MSSAGKINMEEAIKTLPKGFTMRDIFDFCTKFNLHNLAQGMIELSPPKKMRERVANLCLTDETVHQYRNRMGEEEYRVAIKNFLARHYNINVPLESVLATSRVSGAIFSTLLTLRNEKRGQPLKVGLLVPFYTYHQKQIMELLGSEPEYIQCNDIMSPNFANIESALKSGLDLIIFCNPGNPQGNVWTKEEMCKLVDLTKSYKCMMLIDEIYCDLVWTGTHYTPIQDKIHDHVIVCRGFAKTLAAQSWRCAYMITAPSMIDKIMRIHDPIYISVPFLQHAIAQYLANDYEDFVMYKKQIGDLMRNNWKLLSKALQKRLGWIPIEPSGSMYGMFKHNSTTDEEALFLGLKCGVGVAPGRIFFPKLPENTGYVRIHCGISASKTEAIVKILENQ